MIRLSVIANVFLLATAIYLFVNPQRAKFQPDTPSCKVFCSDFSLDKFEGISPALAQRIAGNYRSDQGKRFICNGSVISNAEDANSVWFSLTAIKQFIWQIERAACGKKCRLQLGVRIYYAKYPDSAAMSADPELKDVDPSFARRHTVFMVPTYESNDRNVDFNPWRWDGPTCSPEPYKNQLTKKSIMDLVRDRALILGIQGKNHGELDPPKGLGSFGNN